MSASSLFDAVIVGAGTAGLTAAVMLGRSRRRVLVLDGGPPRNAPAAHAHNVFTRDGTPPEDLLRYARADLEPYTSVEIRDTKATAIEGESGAFEVVLEDGSTVSARAVLLATGVTDELPDVPGVREFWGGTVFHCPYCHGWEVRGTPLAVWRNDPDAVDRAILLRSWSDDVIVLTNGPSTIGIEGEARLEALGIPVLEGEIAALVGTDGLEAVRFEDGSEIARSGILISPPQHESSGLPAALGCELTETGHVATSLMGQTSVSGVYAAGDLMNMAQGVAAAAGMAAMAAGMLNHELAQADAARVLEGA